MQTVLHLEHVMGIAILLFKSRCTVSLNFAFNINMLLLGLVGTQMDHPTLGRQGL